MAAGSIGPLPPPSLFWRQPSSLLTDYLLYAFPQALDIGLPIHPFSLHQQASKLISSRQTP